MNSFVGTNYFDSKICAVRYYAKQGVDKESVEKYLKEGLIIIGVPKKVPEFDLCLDEDGRYWRK